MDTKSSTGVGKVTGLCFQCRQWMESKSEERYTQAFLASCRSLLTEVPRENCSIPVQAPSQPWWLPHLLGVQTVLGDHWSLFPWALVTLAAGDGHSGPGIAVRELCFHVETASVPTAREWLPGDTPS